MADDPKYYVVPQTVVVTLSGHGNLVQDDYRGTSYPVKLVEGRRFVVTPTDRGIDLLRCEMDPGIYRDLAKDPDATDTDTD